MASRNLFTREEIILCTYAALYDDRDLDGVEAIQTVTNRGTGSIRMKIQNIAAMLDDAGVRRLSTVSPLTGLPPGQTGRSTNWDIVEPLTRLSRPELLSRCRSILSSSAKR
jgi:hypothetical protein